MSLGASIAWPQSLSLSIPLLPTVPLRTNLLEAALRFHLWSFDFQIPLSPGKCGFLSLLLEHGRAVLPTAVAFAPQVPRDGSTAEVQHLEMWFSISCTETCQGTTTHYAHHVLVIRAAASAISQACIFLRPHLRVGSAAGKALV